ncbi:MAG: hypothetical protein ABIG28_02700 [archaeon]
MPSASTPKERINKEVILKEGYRAVALKALEGYRGLGTPEEIGVRLSELESIREELRYL